MMRLTRMRRATLLVEGLNEGSQWYRRRPWLSTRATGGPPGSRGRHSAMLSPSTIDPRPHEEGTMADQPLQAELAQLRAHAGNIGLIYGAGITRGCVPDQEYCPTANVTREEMASFLARTAGLGSNPP